MTRQKKSWVVYAENTVVKKTYKNNQVTFEKYRKVKYKAFYEIMNFF